MSHAHVRSLPRHPPILPKPEAEAVAADVVAWFGECLQFLCPENWGFAVDSDGKYLPGVSVWVEPMPFMFDTDSWEFTLCCTPLMDRTPHNKEDLTMARERIHLMVTIVIMNLTSSVKAGKLLAKFRKDYDLKKLRGADIL